MGLVGALWVSIGRTKSSPLARTGMDKHSRVGQPTIVEQLAQRDGASARLNVQSMTTSSTIPSATASATSAEASPSTRSRLLRLPAGNVALAAQAFALGTALCASIVGAGAWWARTELDVRSMRDFAKWLRHKAEPYRLADESAAGALSEVTAVADCGNCDANNVHSHADNVHSHAGNVHADGSKTSFSWLPDMRPRAPSAAELEEPTEGEFVAALDELWVKANGAAMVSDSDKSANDCEKT